MNVTRRRFLSTCGRAFAIAALCPSVVTTLSTPTPAPAMGGIVSPHTIKMLPLSRRGIELWALGENYYISGEELPYPRNIKLKEEGKNGSN
jgi:hypothetical protein